MKLEVGMYVRTKKGNIYKFETNNSMAKNGAKKYIVKASYNIIDILEIGDYVNGHRIEEIDFDDEEIFTDSEYYCGVVEFCNIKSVITHEQMEQMAYKVGD